MVGHDSMYANVAMADVTDIVEALPEEVYPIRGGTSVTFNRILCCGTEIE